MSTPSQKKLISNDTSGIWTHTGPPLEFVFFYPYLRGGGTYGLFGGFDITLLELERPIFGFRTACLPR